jgi:PAS domain S-box-containing protein
MAIFIFIKFLLIVLVQDDFGPQFILDFTPYYLLSGTNNMDLLLLSLLVVVVAVYLHFNVSKKNLMYSFIPTGVMLSGLGIAIATGDMGASYILHFLIFGCLILIALIDQKQCLEFQDMDITPTIEKVVSKTTKDNSFVGMESPDRPYPMFGQPLRIEGLDEILTLHKQTLMDLRTIMKDDIQRAQNVMENLEKKAEKLNFLSEEIETRRKNLIEDEKLFRNRLMSRTNGDIKFEPTETKVELISEDKTIEKKTGQPTMLDDFLGSAVIVKRGVLKQVSQPFLDLLGYESNALLEKNLVDLIAPESLSDFQKDYADKLKGKLISSYETVLLTKENKKIRVEITVKPMVYDKKPVDLILVRTLNR